MHAYLLVGQEISNLKSQISNLAKKLNTKILEYPLQKIDDVRSLNSLIRLSFNEPTLIVSNDIHEAGEEALNAFLKNLEEPQENIFFVLTAPSTKKVLPTIVSRCQVIKISNLKSQISNFEGAEEFMKYSVGEKLAYIDKIKDRDKAVEFVENTVFFFHRSLHENGVKYTSQAKLLETASRTLSRLKANGNVNLQLTNLVIQIANIKT